MGRKDDKGRIQGVVTTSDGKPAAAVIVRIQETNFTTLTGEDGSFSFTNLTPGEYTIAISLIGYKTTTQHIIVKDNRATTVLLQLEVSKSQLQEVTITGSSNKFMANSSDDIGKLRMKNLENPQVYNVVTNALMKEQMLTNFNDALRNVPGLTKLFTGGGDFNTTFVSRGFATTANLRNGISAANTSDLDPANIEKIEVLKGPAGTLFGSTLVSWGGLINRVTKQPYGHLGGEIAYTAGSYGLSRFTGDVNLPFNKDSSLLFRLNAAHTEQGSFMDYGFTKSTFIAPTLVYKPSERLTISLEAEFYQREGTSYPSFFIFDSMVARSPKDLNMAYKRSFTTNEINFNSPTTDFFGQIKYKLSSHWTSQTAVSIARGVNNGLYQWDNFLSGNADSLIRTITDWEGNITTTTEIQQNFISDYTWGKLRNRLVAGLDFYNSTGVGNYYYITFDTLSVNNPGPAYLNLTPSKLTQMKAGGTVGPYASNDDKQYVYAAYVSDAFNLTDNLIINAALRVDHFDNKGLLDPITAKTRGGYAQTALSPKFGIVYQPLKDKIALFANYSNGFQNNSGVDFNGNAFRPSNGNQVEAGVKIDIWQHKISGTVSYYNIHAADLLENDPYHSGFSIQDAKQTSKGFEASIIAAPFAGFNLVAGYSYNNKIYQGAGDNAGSPGNTVNLYASYHLPDRLVKGLGISFGGNYAGEVLPSAGTFALPAYTILNASLFYDRLHYRIGIKIDNLTNQQYWIGWYDMEPQMLRNISATVAIKF